jgi:energy-coupling factor transporter ATP-binding protein EcfA2
MLTRMPGGAIGLSGPRGVGKSTLMRFACGARQNQDGHPVLGVVVDAPVEYDARDFILHLFAQVCSQIVGPARVLELRGWDRPFGGRSGLGGVLRLRPYLFAGPALMLTGVVLWRGQAWADSINLSLDSWGVVLLMAGSAATLATLLLEALRARQLAERRAPVPHSERPRKDVNTAMVRLRQIWFQQSYSSGWSGAFKIPLASLEGKVNSGTELADRQMSYPDVVRLFREFLEQISSEELEVRIGIDELDKMDDEAACRFLNGIKAVFRIPSCFFFVSVSEDAMSSFERRGAPVRDVFDSSFDDVLWISHLGLSASIDLLERRVVGLPVPFSCLLHSVSGGLPRDLIRAARNLFELEKGSSLAKATAHLAGEMLRGRVEATSVTARRFESVNHVAIIAGWLEKVWEADRNPAPLLEICANFEADFFAEIAALPVDVELGAERRELRALGTQLVGVLYLVATMLQFFALLDDRTSTEKAIAPDRQGGPSQVERMASAVQVFSLDVETAWRQLSRMRTDLGLRALDFPRSGLQSEDHTPHREPSEAV